MLARYNWPPSFGWESGRCPTWWELVNGIMSVFDVVSHDGGTYQGHLERQSRSMWWWVDGKDKRAAGLKEI